MGAARFATTEGRSQVRRCARAQSNKIELKQGEVASYPTGRISGIYPLEGTGYRQPNYVAHLQLLTAGYMGWHLYLTMRHAYYMLPS